MRLVVRPDTNGGGDIKPKDWKGSISEAVDRIIARIRVQLSGGDESNGCVGVTCIGGQRSCGSNCRSATERRACPQPARWAGCGLGQDWYAAEDGAAVRVRCSRARL